MPNHRPQAQTQRDSPKSEKLAVHPVRLSWIRAALHSLPTRYDRCGHGVIVGHSENDDSRVIIPMWCRRWDCPTCASRKKKLWQQRAREGRPERLLTLTLRRRKDDSLTQALLLAKASLPKLIAAIRRKFPRIEYLASWQFTKAGWPHAHLMTRGSYLPQAWLSNQWHRITGSKIVDIRKIHGPNQAALYITRYMLRDVTRHASLFQGFRVITMSRKWLPTREHPKDREKWSGWTWSYEPRGIEEVLKDWNHQIIDEAWTDLDMSLFVFTTYQRKARPQPRPPPRAYLFDLSTSMPFQA